MQLAYFVLHKLGATGIAMKQKDPQTEEEFLALNYVSSTPISWSDYQAKYAEVLQNTAFSQLRAHRNRLIARTDWILMPDTIDTIANKPEWIAYRQALRDLPANPPPFVWKGNLLDFSQMNMPVEPPVVRVPISS
jgi:hypothetical protein